MRRASSPLAGPRPGSVPVRCTSTVRSVLFRYVSEEAPKHNDTVPGTVLVRTGTYPTGREEVSEHCKPLSDEVQNSFSVKRDFI